MKKWYIVLIALVFSHFCFSAPFKDQWKVYKDTHAAMLFGKETKSSPFSDKPIGSFPLIMMFFGAGYLGWKLAEADDLKTTQPVGPIVHKFVENTLSQMGYTAYEIQKLKVTDNRRLEYCNKAIVLDISDENLVAAMKLQKAGKGYKILDQDHYDRSKKWHPKLSHNDLLLILASYGKALTSDTIALLKWDIISQANQVLSSSVLRDTLEFIIWAAVCVYLGSYLHERNANFVSLETIPAALPLSIYTAADFYNLRKSFKHADLSIVRRCYEKDPEVVRTQIKLLKAYDHLNRDRSFIGKWFVACFDKLGGLKNHTEWLDGEYKKLEKASNKYKELID